MNNDLNESEIVDKKKEKENKKSEEKSDIEEK